MGSALMLALLPALLGFAVGRWWLLLIGALLASTALGRLLGADGVAAGPLVVLALAPFLGCAAGVALRRLVAPPRDPV
jgi:hypothetical protein